MFRRVVAKKQRILALCSETVFLPTNPTDPFIILEVLRSTFPNYRNFVDTRVLRLKKRIGRVAGKLNAAAASSLLFSSPQIIFLPEHESEKKTGKKHKEFGLQRDAKRVRTWGKRPLH